MAKHIKVIKRIQLPENIYNLAKSYLSERIAIFTTNSTHMEREVTKGCPQCSCCGPGFWNIQYNSLLNLKFGKRTKAIAYADDLLIAVKAETVREAKNYVNIEISKITKCAKDNKITYNEQKSRAMVVTRKKRRENNYTHTKRTGHGDHHRYKG